MARCGQCGETLTGCQCSMADSDCFEITGAGTGANPFKVVPNLDVDPLNIAECNPSGFGAFLPEVIRNPPCCRIYRTIPQVIPAGTLQIIIFNAELYDTDSMHDNAVNGDRITFNTSGVYTLSAHMSWQANGVGDRRIDIRINGLTVIASQEASVDSGTDPFQMNVSTSGWKFAAGEYAQVTVANSSGADLNMETVPEYSPHFVASRLAIG